MFKKSLAAAVSLVLTTSVFAMDARYEDRTGNLTADLPQNEAEWANPSTLIFAYTPVEDPSVYASVWKEAGADRQACRSMVSTGIGQGYCTVVGNAKVFWSR